jgi:transposase
MTQSNSTSQPNATSSTQGSQPGKRRYRQFSDEFKRNAVNLIVNDKYTFKAAANAVNVSEKSLRDWHAKFAPQPKPCGENATTEQMRDEIKHLRKQLKQAETEREILKKAAAYFAKESQ